MKDACDVKRLSLKYEYVKDSKRIEYDELDNDSHVSSGKQFYQHPEEMQFASKLLFCCYCRTICYLFSNFSVAVLVKLRVSHLVIVKKELP